MTYVNLQLNPERYTGYTGPSARRIWDSVYSENCPKCNISLLISLFLIRVAFFWSPIRTSVVHSQELLIKCVLSSPIGLVI